MTADALFDLPDHYVKDRALWRRRVQRRRDLTPGARLYAGYLAFHRCGKGRVAWARERAAAAIGVSVRTIQRWTRELLDAGMLRRLVSAMPGRQQVFALVKMGDTGVSPSGRGLPKTTRATPRLAAQTPGNTPTRRTTTGRPAHTPGATLIPTGARHAGDGT